MAELKALVQNARLMPILYEPRTAPPYDTHLDKRCLLTRSTIRERMCIFICLRFFKTRRSSEWVKRLLEWKESVGFRSVGSDPSEFPHTRANGLSAVGCNEESGTSEDCDRSTVLIEK